MRLLFTICFFSLITISRGQNLRQLPDLPHSVDRAFSFVLNNNLIFGTGINEEFVMNNEVWMYDLQKQAWTQLNNFPTVPIRNCISMVINDTAYVGFGRDNNRGYGWFMYDKDNDKWIEKNSQCNVGQFSATFTYKGKGYAICGSGKQGETSETWVYDPERDYWAQKSDFPGSPRDFPFGCVLNDKAYVGMGDNFLSPPFYNDIYEYDFISDSWKEIIPIPLSSTLAEAAGACFFSRTLDQNSFAIMALDGIFTNDLRDYNTIYVYDQKEISWTLYEDANPVGSRGVPVVGHFNAKSYYGGGNDFVGGVKNDFWEFDFTPILSKIVEDKKVSKKLTLNFNGYNHYINIPSYIDNVENITLTLTNIDGKLLKFVKLDSDYVMIDLGSSDGIYLYSIQKGARIIKSGKLLFN